jgi:hypothetical protein
VPTTASRYEQTHLELLEAESVHIFREVSVTQERPALFSGGKDSVVMLHLATRTFWPRLSRSPSCTSTPVRTSTRSSLSSPYRGDRDKIRDSHVAAELPFVEVLVDTPLEMCEARDPKGLREGRGAAGRIAPRPTADSGQRQPAAGLRRSGGRRDRRLGTADGVGTRQSGRRPAR